MSASIAAGRRGQADELVAAAGAAVGERLPRLGNELPVVAARVERQLEDAERVPVAHLTVRLRGTRDRVVVLAAGADDELANAAGRVRCAGRRLGREALIVVVVPVEDDVCARVVEVLPDRLHRDRVAVLPGAEARVMPVGERARRSMSRQVSAQPRLLPRARLAAAYSRAVAVDDDDVPGAELVAVVPAVRRTGGCAEVREVAGGAGGEVLVVAGSGMSARKETTPGRGVAVGVVAR